MLLIVTNMLLVLCGRNSAALPVSSRSLQVPEMTPKIQILDYVHSALFWIACNKGLAVVMQEPSCEMFLCQ